MPIMNSIVDIGSLAIPPKVSVTLAVLLATRLEGTRNNIIASVHTVPFIMTDSVPKSRRRPCANRATPTPSRPQPKPSPSRQ